MCVGFPIVPWTPATTRPVSDRRSTIFDGEGFSSSISGYVPIVHLSYWSHLIANATLDAAVVYDNRYINLS